VGKGSSCGTTADTVSNIPQGVDSTRLCDGDRKCVSTKKRRPGASVRERRRDDLPVLVGLTARPGLRLLPRPRRGRIRVRRELLLRLLREHSRTR
jgi:hypothetical protein